MARIASTVADLIGGTPLVRIQHVAGGGLDDRAAGGQGARGLGRVDDRAGDAILHRRSRVEGLDLRDDVHAVTGDVLGYAGLLVAADEGYITNVAVFPEQRRRGIAGQLLQVFLNFAEANHLAFLTLEVRPSNAAAIALYQGFDFQEAGRRKNYYDLPKEDALILTRRFDEEAAQ